MNAKHQSAYQLLQVVCLMLCLPFAQAQGAASDWLADPLHVSPPQIALDATTQPCHTPPAEATSTLTLGSAVDLALCHNPDIATAWATIRQQAAARGEARAAYLPTLSAGITRQQQQSRYPGSANLRDSSITTDSRYATLTWRLLDFGNRAAKQRAADQLLEAAMASQHATVQRIMREVITLYFAAQAAQAERDGRAEGMRIADEILALSQRREAQGIAAHTDSLQAATAQAKAKLELARATARYDSAVLALALQLGLPQQSLRFPPLAVQPPSAIAQAQRDLAAWQTLAIEQHPAIMAAYAQWQAAKEKYTASRTEGLPVLDFSHSRYLNGRPNQEISARQSRETVTGLTLSIPLFEGFSRHYQQQGAAAQIALRQAQWQQTRNQVLHDVNKTYGETSTSLHTMEAAGHLLTLAMETLQAIQKKYARGLADTQDMLNAQASLADARQERIRTVAEWHSAQLRLLADAGQLQRAAVE